MTIDEQIEYMRSIVATSLLPTHMPKSILASLERLKAIDAVQVPDEPDAVKYLREKFGDGSKGFVRLWDGRAIAIVNLIDTLRDLLKQCKHNASVTMDELAEKTRLLVEARDTLSHGMVFFLMREKMHETGIALAQDLITRIDSAIKEQKCS